MDNKKKKFTRTPEDYGQFRDNIEVMLGRELTNSENSMLVLIFNCVMYDDKHSRAYAEEFLKEKEKEYAEQVKLYAKLRETIKERKGR